MKFHNGEEMLWLIKCGVDLYSPERGIYVFLYNEEGSIAYYPITVEEARELRGKSQGDKDYWSAFLGMGGYILDGDDAAQWCDYHHRREWYVTDNKDLDLILDQIGDKN